jgi:adenylate kinase
MKIRQSYHHIVMFGAPGAGKGTLIGGGIVKDSSGGQEEVKGILDACPDFKHVSIGDAFRAQIKQNTLLGQYSAPYVKSGDFVPDAGLFRLLTAMSVSLQQNIIWDGFPRNLFQLSEFESIIGRHNKSKDSSLFIKLLGVELYVSEKTAKERINFRASQQNRADDTMDIARNRLDLYQKLTIPVINAMKDSGFPCLRLDGENTPHRERVRQFCKFIQANGYKCR